MCIWVPKSHLPKTKAECQKISSFPQREGFPEENNGRIRSLATNEGLEAPGGSRQSPRPLGHPRPPPLSQSSGHRGRHRPSSTSCRPAPIVPVPTQSAWACNVEERQKELTGRHPAQPAPWAPPPALLSPSCPPVFLVSRVPAAMASERSSGHRLRVFCDPAGSATGLCTRGWGGGAPHALQEDKPRWGPHGTRPGGGTHTLLSVRDRLSASLDRLCCSLSLALVAGARAWPELT